MRYGNEIIKETPTRIVQSMKNSTFKYIRRDEYPILWNHY